MLWTQYIHGNSALATLQAFGNTDVLNTYHRITFQCLMHIVLQSADMKGTSEAQAGLLC